MKVIVFDPSGNTGKEGNGTSGIARFIDGELDSFWDIEAANYNSEQEYFFAHREMIEKEFPDIIVCESYDLFGHKAKSQSGSSLPTAKLLGYLMMVAYELNIKWVLQSPSQKTRVADPQLEKLGVIEKRSRYYYCQGKMTNLHMRDAIRHGIFFHRYNKEWLDATNNKTSN